MSVIFFAFSLIVDVNFVLDSKDIKVFTQIRNVMIGNVRRPQYGIIKLYEGSIDTINTLMVLYFNDINITIILLQMGVIGLNTVERVGG